MDNYLATIKTCFKQIAFLSLPFAISLWLFVLIFSIAHVYFVPEDLYLGLTYTTCFVAICLFITYSATRNIAKASLFCSLFAFLAPIYRGLHEYLANYFSSIWKVQLPTVASLVLYVLLVALLFLAVKPLNPARLSACLLVAILFMLSREIPQLYDANLKQIAANEKMVVHFQEPFNKVSLQPSPGKPDVYYIILDTYGQGDTLKECWNYDNSSFINFLKDKGFYVAEHSHSNYDRTIFSVSSVLNMQYLDDTRPPGYKLKSDEKSVYIRLTQNNAVGHLFRQAGYQLINLSSGGACCGTDYMPNYDRNYRKPFGGELHQVLLSFTPLFCSEEYFPLLRDSLADVRLAPGEFLKKVVQLPGPKFVLVHSCLPHPPYIFDESGKRKKLDLAQNWSMGTDPLPYLSQLKMSETEAEKWITTILDGSDTRPVIIIQADHGPWFNFPDKTKYYNERMRILNAYYLPGTNNRGLYDSITPVNSFRLVFNNYFNAKIPLLPDRSFCPPDDDLDYCWDDVTSKFTYASPNGTQDKSRPSNPFNICVPARQRKSLATSAY